MVFNPYAGQQQQSNGSQQNASSSQPFVPSAYASSGQQQPASQYSAPTSSYNSAPSSYTPAAYASTTASTASSPFTPSAYGSTATPTAPSAQSNQAMPSFSQALDLPPPTQQQQQQSPHTNAPVVVHGTYASSGGPSYGANAGGAGGGYANSNTSGSTANARYKNSATSSATGVANNYSSSSGSTNSSVYTGGPTNGLVSEGNPQICHKVDYEIKGHEMQMVEVELDPSETVIAEAGAMMFLEEGIDFKAKFGDGSTPKQGFFKNLLAAGGRLLTGESLFLTHFTNQGQTKARVAFAAPYPGNLLPINMANIGGTLICQKDAFVCAAFGTKLAIHFNKRIGSGLFGGEGFILQKLSGDGMAFVHAGGTIIKRELKGERLRVDTGCLVAFTEGINYDIQLVPGLKSMFFGGEGLFLATLQGHGTVWLQSLPFSRMADRIIQAAPSAGGRRQGEGSALTGAFGGLLDGDGF